MPRIRLIRRSPANGGSPSVAWWQVWQSSPRKSDACSSTPPRPLLVKRRCVWPYAVIVCVPAWQRSSTAWRPASPSYAACRRGFHRQPSPLLSPLQSSVQPSSSVPSPCQRGRTNRDAPSPTLTPPACCPSPPVSPHGHAPHQQRRRPLCRAPRHRRRRARPLPRAPARQPARSSRSMLVGSRSRPGIGTTTATSASARPG